MKERHIFKVAILTHDSSLYEKLREGIFGIDFDKSYTETRGAAFAYSHFTIGDRRVTAQFWCVDATPQFALVRHLYLKGSSGVIVLIDPRSKRATELINRLIREFISVNRYPVPMIVLSAKDGSTTSASSAKYAKELERWSGFETPHVDLDEKDETTDASLNKFMNRVKDWRARNVVFQTLKLYFDLDSINNKTRSIDRIISQLRQIYTNTYYKLIKNDDLKLLIRQAAENEGFSVNSDNTEVIYSRKLRKTSFT